MFNEREGGFIITFVFAFLSPALLFRQGRNLILEWIARHFAPLPDVLPLHQVNYFDPVEKNVGCFAPPHPRGIKPPKWQNDRLPIGLFINLRFNTECVLSMVVISGRNVSDFVLEFWILNFKLFCLHFIFESSSDH